MITLAMVAVAFIGVSQAKANAYRVPTGYQGSAHFDNGGSCTVTAGAPATDDPNMSNDIIVSYEENGFFFSKLYQWDGDFYVNRLGGPLDIYAIQGPGWPVGGQSGIGTGDPMVTGGQPTNSVGGMMTRTR